MALRLGLALLAVALLPLAAAYDEQDAGLLRPDIVAAGHSPAVVQPHTQWHGFLQLRPGSPVVAAKYQICRVGEACFAPPAPARLENGTLSFDTADYKANGHPVDYLAGWRIGVQWILTERTENGTRDMPFPAGPAPGDAACSGDAQAVVCQEEHYLAFDMPPASQGAPGLGAVAVLLALAVAAVGARRRG